MVFYYPIAILLPLTLSFMYAKNKGLIFVCTYIFVALWLFFGTMIRPQYSPLGESQHWGGDYWGPRYMAPLLPFITLTCGTLLQRLKGNKLFLKISAIIILSVAGFLVNLLGILIWWAWFLLNHDQLQGYELMTWDPYRSFIINHIGFLMSNYISHVKPVEFTFTSYGLAPCSYNVYLYCKFGHLPILLLCGLIAIVGTIILMNISDFKCPLLILNRLRIK